MNRIVLKLRVDADGVLRISIPIGASDADREVQVTIEPAEEIGSKRLAVDEWRRFVAETAGALQGDLPRPEQGEFECRDVLP
jgi:hypothetical protein